MDSSDYRHLKVLTEGRSKNMIFLDSVPQSSYSHTFCTFVFKWLLLSKYIHNVGYFNFKEIKKKKK